MAEAEEAVATWLEAEPVDPETGLPIADLLRACAALAHWAQRQAAAGVPLAASLAAHALALAEAAREAGIATVPRLDLERLLDAILAEGEADPEAPAEATGWGIAAAPGAVWAPAPRLLWWGFDAPGLPSALPWSDVEQAALREAGCLPWKPEVALAATAMAWRRPLLAARHAAVLVAIRPVGAEAHPLAHELAPLLEPNPALRPRAEALLMAEAPTLAGVTLPRAPAETLALPVARAEWQGGVAVPVRRPRDSATAIEALLGCPFGWTMQHRAKLQPGRFAEIAQDERLIGLLAHALAAELLPAGTTTPDPAALAAAAPLLHPGAAGELARLRERLPAAMAALGWLLTAGRFTVVAAEAPREAEGLPETGELLGGTIDLLLEDEQGRPALLDLKWTRSGRGYRKRLEEGRAVQLAAYAQLTGAGERAAYFLLADAHAVGPNGTMPAVERVPAPSLAATWAGVRQSRAGRAAALAEGRLRALGVFDGKRPPPDPDGAALAPEAPCNFCSFGRLCGKAAVA
jgi:hypothetical protein